jgi:hypothetical protein
MLRTPDPVEGGTAPAGTPAPAGDPPKAAAKVKKSKAREGDALTLVELERQLSDERAGRKKDQTRLSELEDENRRLKNPGTLPAKDPPKADEKKGWLDGATFFG